MLFPRSVTRNYRIAAVLGEGVFSKVYLGEHRVTKQQVAIKRTEKQRVRRLQKEQAREGSYLAHMSRDVRLLQLLAHPNIVTLYQVVETADAFFLILDYAGGGSLLDFVQRRGKLEESVARHLFRQLASAVAHCHACGVLHRDIKLDNMLLTEQNDLMLSDFGLGRFFQPEDLCATFCGTPMYASPELIRASLYRGPPIDIWSMGVALFIMVNGEPPFRHNDVRELYEIIKRGEFAMPTFISEELSDLFRRIFVVEVAERATIDEILAHPWLMIGYDLPIPLYPVPAQVSRFDVGVALAESTTSNSSNSTASSTPRLVNDQCRSISFDANEKCYDFAPLPGAVAPAIPKRARSVFVVHHNGAGSSNENIEDGSQQQLELRHRIPSIAEASDSTTTARSQNNDSTSAPVDSTIRSVRKGRSMSMADSRPSIQADLAGGPRTLRRSTVLTVRRLRHLPHAEIVSAMVDVLNMMSIPHHSVSPYVLRCEFHNALEIEESSDGVSTGHVTFDLELCRVMLFGAICINPVLVEGDQSLFKLVLDLLTPLLATL